MTLWYGLGGIIVKQLWGGTGRALSDAPSVRKSSHAITLIQQSLQMYKGGEGGAAAGGRCYLLIKPAVRNGGKKFEGQINFVVWAWRERKGIRRAEGLRCLGVATNVSLC